MGKRKETPFYAIVGAEHEVKMELFRGLKKAPELHGFFFITDNGHDEEDNPFVRYVTGASRLNLHEHAHPVSQLLFYWSRLTTIIADELVPHLSEGKPVIMVGFGASVLAHAMLNAKSDHERMSLRKTHLACVENCVYGLGINAPRYLRLRSDPKRMPHLAEKISFMDVFYHEYSKIPGQHVHDIPGSGRKDRTLARVLDIIVPERVEKRLSQLPNLATSYA